MGAAALLLTKASTRVLMCELGSTPQGLMWQLCLCCMCVFVQIASSEEATRSLLLSSKVQGAVQAEAEEVMERSEASVPEWRGGDDVWAARATCVLSALKEGSRPGGG